MSSRLGNWGRFMLIFLIRDRQDCRDEETSFSRCDHASAAARARSYPVLLPACAALPARQVAALAVDEIRIRPSTATRDLCMFIWLPYRLIGRGCGRDPDAEFFPACPPAFGCWTTAAMTARSPGSGTTHQVVFPACRQQQKAVLPGFSDETA